LWVFSTVAVELHYPVQEIPTMPHGFNLRMIEAVFLALLVTGVGAMLAAQDAKPTIKTVPAARMDPSDGKAMFQNYCGSCHGLDAKGRGPAVPALKMAPGDLTMLTKNNGGKFPELRVYNAIVGDTNLPAHGSKDMPVWGTLFRTMGPADGNEAKLRVRNLTKFIETIQVK
jgi:mono/diheme cytochrome c family protein